MEPDSEKSYRLQELYGWETTGCQSVPEDVKLWFSSEHPVYTGYVSRFKVRVTTGLPVGPVEHIHSTVAEFEQEAYKSNEIVCYLGVQRKNLLPPSHSSIRIGAQPVWNPAVLSERFHERGSLRAQVRRTHNKGLKVEEWPIQCLHSLSSLRICLDQWLARLPMAPLRFLTDPYILDRMRNHRIFIAFRNDSPAAYLVLTPIPGRSGWLAEQIIRGNKAPNGAGMALLAAVSHKLAQEGSNFLTLGLTPLSKHGQTEEFEPAWIRAVLSWARSHGKRFYNFQGLEAFRERLQPASWEPIYAVSNNRSITPRILMAIASSFSDKPLYQMALHSLHASFNQWVVQPVSSSDQTPGRT